MIILDAPWIEDINKIKLLQIWTFLTFFVFWTKRFQSGLVCTARGHKQQITNKKIKLAFRWHVKHFEFYNTVFISD